MVSNTIYSLDPIATPLPSTAKLASALDTLTRDLGFATYTLVGLRGFHGSDAIPPYLTSVAPDWEHHYQAQGLAQADPVLNHCLEHTTPVRFHDLERQGLTPAQRTMMNQARDFQQHLGVGIPVHGPRQSLSILAFYHQGDRDGREAAERHLPLLTMAAGYAHEQLARLANPPPAPTQLTARESECLLWTAQGKTAWEIAAILNLSERTVKFHLNNVMRKLGVHSRTHAVAKAVSLGLPI